MEVSDVAKAQGFKSLAQVARLFGTTTESLRRWHKQEPRKFQIVLDGCKVLLEKEAE